MELIRRKLSVLLFSAILIAATGSPKAHAVEPGFELYASPQSRPLALSLDGDRLFVAHTTGHAVSVLDAESLSVITTIEVGMEPVSLALRPDGRELWVSNHVSDSVSVIDTDLTSSTLHSVIGGVQAFDPSGATVFDEPVGIAFRADGALAYVALSSRNQVAVVDVAARSVVRTLSIGGQDPRAVAVRGGLLYVAAFESGNRTELSACIEKDGTDQCTLGLEELEEFVNQPNLPGHVKNIVVDSAASDFDLFVFDTASDTPIDVVEGVGTLLYGLAVAGDGRAYIAATDARNAENGLDGETLTALENRIFLNRVVTVECGGAACGAPTPFELEPLPPSHPAAGREFATPYGIELSGDEGSLFVTLAGTNRLLAMEAATGVLQGSVDVGASPRAVVLQNDAGGAAQRAFVLNTLDDSISVVDVADPLTLVVQQTIPFGNDPTPEPVRRGRRHFNDAFLSSTGTFSCASCHPDAHTDQLVWRIGGGCVGCAGDEPRTTMPIRGLRDTLPLHWDGTLGDPFGGGNGAGEGGPPDCALGDEDGDLDCFADLVHASLSGVMCDQAGSCPAVPDEAVDEMAHFLRSVAYPPARARRLDDSVSEEARRGFRDFFTDRGGVAAFAGAVSCADNTAGCHSLPLLSGTNSNLVSGFDAPTLRGLPDRFLQFSNGLTATQEVLSARSTWQHGDVLDEFTVFSASFPGFGFQSLYGVGPENIFAMLEELSHGQPGALGRQVYLNPQTLEGAALPATEARWVVLEQAARDGLVTLSGTGALLGEPVAATFDPALDRYSVGGSSLSRSELLGQAVRGEVNLALTAFHAPGVGHPDSPRPLLGADAPPPNPNPGPLSFPSQAADPVLPSLPRQPAIQIPATDVRADARLFVEGQRVAGEITCLGGTFDLDCSSDRIEVVLDRLPNDSGLHRLQLQNPGGLLSNELPFFVTADAIPRDAARCILALNQSGAKLVKARTRHLPGCVAGGAGTPRDCLEREGARGVAALGARARRAELRQCKDGRLPSFGFTGTDAVAAGADAEATALAEDLFGSALDTPADGTDPDLARCRGKVTKKAVSVLDRLLRAANRAKARGLRGRGDANLIRTAGELRSALAGASAESNRTISKRVQKVHSAATRACVGVDLALAFPGCQAAAPGALVTCVERAARCRACRSLSAFDDATLDCDVLDDGTANGSC